MIWDTGSSLYDSYELASLNQILDRHLTALPLPDESLQKEPTGALLPMERRNHKQEVVFRAHRSKSRKVTLRALVRAVATWAIRPRQAHACACVGVAPSGAIEFEPSVSHGKP